MHLLRLDRNLNGQDYVVGDIHGHFDEFDQLLQDVSFNPEVDRIISVGDYIDRGPHSARALEYLEKPWFYSVKGNHEAMLAASLNYEPGIYDVWMRNGGEWSEQVSEEVLQQFADIYNELPYIIEVDTIHGPVGVVHADLPEAENWEKLLSKLEKGKLKDDQLQVMLWSRNSYRRLRMAMLYPGSYDAQGIEGVHRVYIGHSIVGQPREFGSFFFIDTGAYANGQLTMVNLASEQVFAIDVISFDPLT